MSDRQRDHVKRYMKSFAEWKEKNLGAEMSHQLAAAVAREEFKLDAEEQRAVDEWLDEKFPERKKKREPESGAPSLFDDLPRVT